MAPARCTGTRSDGKPCQGWAITGSDKCTRHLPHPAARYRAVVRAEVLKWGLGDTHTNPEEVLLRLVSQSAARAEHYAELLQQQYAAAERGDETADLPHKIGVLIGHKYGVTRDGDTVPVEEAIRGLVVLEGQERDRLAHFAGLAVKAGLAKRQVELAEQQGRLIADVLRAVLDDPDLGLTEAQRRMVPAVARRVLDLPS